MVGVAGPFHDDVGGDAHGEGVDDEGASPGSLISPAPTTTRSSVSAGLSSDSVESISQDCFSTKFQSFKIVLYICSDVTLQSLETVITQVDKGLRGSLFRTFSNEFSL